MDLCTKRETLCGRMGARKQYVVYLNGQSIGNGDTKEVAQAMAKQALSDAYEYLSRASVVRVARDGSILVFRLLSADTAMYEFHRNGKPASGCCMGRMTNGNGETIRTLDAYADYVVGRYNS